VLPCAKGGGTKVTGAAGGIAFEVAAAPTAIPHPPQNPVVALIGAPHPVQVIVPPGVMAAGAGDAGTTGVPHIPQNFSIPPRGLPQDLHTGGVPDDAATPAGCRVFGGATGLSSTTFARHFLQNLSPGLII
jgi:hypothetical protein